MADVKKVKKESTDPVDIENRFVAVKKSLA
jgi:hypothetical protein